MEKFEDKYIDLLLKRCINFDTSKSLLICIDLKEHLLFAEKVKERANKMGVYDVSISVNDRDELHSYLKNTDISDIKIQPCLDRHLWDEYAIKGGGILILSSEVPGLMSDISPDKIRVASKIINSTRPFYFKYVGQYRFPWCIANLPNERWADKVFPNDVDAYKKLYLSIMKMCMIDKDDPIKSWQDYIDKNNYFKNKLNELEITGMHYKNSLGTDFYVGKDKDTIWINSDKTDYFGNKIISNMPSYEIFTTPDYRKAEGIIYSSRPLIYNGTLIDQFYLKFHNGKVIDCGAMVGDDVLKSLVFEGFNTNMLGEVALVPHDSPISNTGIVFYETLFDENASCHFALGSGFPKCIKGYENLSEEELLNLGCNIASIHVDFMIGTSDMEIEADTKEGKKLIFKNGNFCI